MLYSENNKWAFVHVPKNAGTSVEYPFHKFSNPNFQNAKIEKGVKILHKGNPTHHNKWSYWSQFDEVKNHTPVALLRNPWDRCLSLYTFNLKECAKNLDQEWARIDHARLIKEGFKQSWMPDGFFVDKHGLPFEYNTETGRAWSQNDDQASWLEDAGKWFRMEDQMDEFCNFTGLDIPQKVNTTVRGAYQRYYDEELRHRIDHLFYRDIELGGYKF
jgi:hypothetical protein